MTSKVDGAAVLPAVVVLLIANGRTRRENVIGGVAFLAAFGVTFVALYAPLGLRSAIGYMIRFQLHHKEAGHLTFVAGHLYRHPPWWSILWFERVGVGTLTIAVLGVGMVLALAITPDRLVLYLGVGLAGPLLFFCAFAGVQLPSYYFPLMWFEGALAAIGYSRAVTTLRPRAVVAIATAVGVLLLGVAAAGVSHDVATQRRTGIQRVASFLRSKHRHGRVLFQRISTDWTQFFPRSRGCTDPAAGVFDAVVIGEDRRFTLDPALETFLDAHRDRFDRVDLTGVVVWLPRRGDLVHRTGGYALTGS